MFYTPVDHARRRTPFSIPESPEVSRQAYRISGRVPPPPGDGLLDDEDSFSSLSSPSPLLPRPTSFPYRDRLNPPGRPDGNGGPGGRYGPTLVWGDGHKRGKSDPDAPVGQSKFEAYFDNKLCLEMVPEWDGNPDTLAQWILKVNLLA